MFTGRRAVTALRYLTGFAIVIGFGGACYGLMFKQAIPLFAFDVPSWVVGASAAYMGIRYWRKIPELERKVDLHGKFSWQNFSRSGAKARRAS